MSSWGGTYSSTGTFNGTINCIGYVSLNENDKFIMMILNGCETKQSGPILMCCPSIIRWDSEKPWKYSVRI